MYSQNISDVAFSLIRNNERNKEIDFSFIYNNYSKNETQTKDSKILNRNFESKDKFIRITHEFLSQESREESEEFSYIFENIISTLSNIDLYESKREYFNKIDNMIPHRKSLMLDNKNSDFSRFKEFYSSNQNSLNIDDISYDKSTTLSIAREEKYENHFKNKEYVENFNYNNLINYDNLIDNQKISYKRLEKEGIKEYLTGNILPGLTYFSETVNLGDIDAYASLNAIYCGKYIEKFILNNEENYKFLSSRFYSAPSNYNSATIKIEDEAIRYGQTYRYACFNVYLYTTVCPEDRFKLKHFLLCDHPYLSNDIVCKEFDAPPEPVGITAQYNLSDRKMLLSWESPTNYEGDVTGYQILKRLSFEEPFKVVKQLEGHSTTDLYEEKESLMLEDITYTPGKTVKHYFDYDFDENKMCIYTIRSIDAHGLKSNYGEQIAVYYDYMRNKLITSLVSESGANISYPNEKLLNKSFFHEKIADYIDNLPIVYKPKKINLYLTPDFAYINIDSNKYKVFSEEYQFTITSLNDFAYRSDKFSIVNFG